MATKKPNTEIAKSENQEAVKLQLVNIDDVSGNSFPDLAEADEVGVELVPDYWTPEEKGEAKRLVYIGTTSDERVNEETGEMETMKSANFLEQVDGQVKKISNASTRLVAAVAPLAIGCPLSITYLGKVKNKTNAFSSDAWSLKYLRTK